MPLAWRIVKERHAGSAFSGEGAARSGGRWNSRGVRLVYASSSRALAALENLVHLNPPVLFRYVAIPIDFNGIAIERLPIAELPPDWRDHPAPDAVRQVGDAWIRSGRTAVLEVPSAIVPGEWNCLLNPVHADFTRIRTGPSEEFSFDPRLFRLP